MEENEVMYFANEDYESALIGITEDNRAVYDYEKMIEYLVEKDGMDDLEAMEWIDYNTIRALPYMGSRHPIIVYPVYMAE